MKKARQLTCILLLVCLLVVTAACSVVNIDGGGKNGASLLNLSKLLGYTSKYSPNTVTVDGYSVNVSPDESVWVTVSLGDGLAEAYLEGDYNFDIDEYLMTSEGKSAVEAMKGEQDVVIARIEDLGIDYTVKHRYTVLDNGFSVNLKYKDVSALASVEGIAGVYISEVYSAPEVTVESVFDDALFGDSGIFANNTDYHGEGMTVAILDTGIDYDHEAFAKMPKVRAFSYDFIEERLPSTQAYSIMKKKLSAGQVYLNEKIPFAFDYADKDAEVKPSQSAVMQYTAYHGTHVAGIAAGDDEAIQGVANNAQLAIMKVFSDASSGAVFTDITAAIEDCIVLGVDVANLSLGATCGYTKDNSASAAKINKTYELADKLGLTLCVATGNDNNSAYDASFNNLNLAANPDNGVVNSPASYAAAFAVGSIMNDPEAFANGTFVTASSSSMGALGDLSIGVDVMGVGGKVLSAINEYYSQVKGTDTHIRLSGTSMATPNVSGVMTVLKQYYKQAYPYATDRQIKIMVRQIMTSTAEVIRNKDGDPLTPRRQGSGVVNLEAAIDAKAYLTVTGSDFAKLNLGSDVNKDGVYTLTYNLVNISSEARSYVINNEVFTETVENGYIIEKAYMFDDAEIKVSVTGGTYENGIITVDGNSEAKLRVVIKLSGDEKTYMDETFVNGIYVEGFSILENTEDGSTLVMPFISFYGDWDEVPMFDGTVYGDDVQTAENAISMVKWSGGVEDYLGPQSVTPLGTYMYTLPSGYEAPEASMDKIAINDTLGIGRIYFSLLRNATEVIIRMQDNVTGVVYDEGSVGVLTKTVMKKGTVNNYGYIDLGKGGEFNASNYTWANNQDLSFVVEAYLESGKSQQLVYNMYIDYEAPTLVEAALVKENGTTTLDMTVFDNHYLQAVMLYVKDGENLKDIVGNAIPVYDFVRNTDNEVSVDITKYAEALGTGDLVVELVDYAGNSAMYTAAEKDEGSEETDSYVLDYTSGYTVSVEQGGNETVGGGYSVALDESWKQGDFYIDGTKLVAYVGQGGEVVVPDGVTEIGEKVFYLNDLVTKVTLPEGVTTIGTAAFSRAYNMTDVVLPTTLKVIGQEAFAGCVKLKNINLEDTKVESYGKYSFIGNEGIETLTIPAADNPIQMTYSFSMMFGLKKLEVLGDVEYTDSCFFVLPELKEVNFYGDVMIGKRNATSNAFQDCNAIEVIRFYGKTAIGREYKLSSGTVVNTNSLICLNSLKEVYFYGDVEFIVGKAFNNCENLEKVVFGGKIGEIGQDAFGVSKKLDKGFDLTEDNTDYIKDEYGIIYNLEKTEMIRPYETEIEGVYTLPETITTLPARAFSHSTNIMFSVAVSYSLGDDGAYTYRISSSSTEYVADREKMTGIVLHDGITSLPERCFADNINLTFDYSGITSFGEMSMRNTGFTALVFGENVTYFGKQVWAYSRKLKELSFPQTAKYASFERFYAGLTMKEIVIPEWMQTAKDMFRESEVETVVLHDGITTLQNFVFYKCENLKEIKGIENITVINGWAFDGCTSIKEINVPNLVTMGSAAFQNCSSLEEVKYGASLKAFGSGAFNFCTSLRRVFIPKTVTNLTASTMSRYFYGCSNFEEFTVEEGHTKYVTVDGALYLNDLSALVCYPTQSKVTEHTLPEAITYIAAGTFENAPYLEKLNYEADTMYVDANAFTDSVNLCEFDLSRVTYIGNQAFRNTALTSVGLHDGIEYVGGYAFADIAALKSISISENAPAFDYSSVFAGCYNVETIDIAEGSKNFIAENGLLMSGDRKILFMGFGDIAELTIPEGVEKISERAFYGNNSVEKVVLPESLIAIGDRAFYGCENLSEIVFRSANAPRLEGFAVENEEYTYANFKAYFEDAEGLTAYVENAPEYLSFVWRTLFDKIYVNGSEGYKLYE